MFLDEKFLQKVYTGNQEIISIEEFVKKFANPENNFNNIHCQLRKGTSMEAPISWFFSPLKMNFVFKQYLARPYKLEEFLNAGNNEDKEETWNGQEDDNLTVVLDASSLNDHQSYRSQSFGCKKQYQKDFEDFSQYESLDDDMKSV